MNIRIDDDVPLPQPDKADTWVSVSTPSAKDDSWVRKRFEGSFTNDNITEVGTLEGWVSEAAPIDPDAWERLGQRYPAETTYDAKGVPTVDCFLVGGPLNGKNGPIVGTAKVVELDIYAADGSVSSVEMYELGNSEQLGVRHWKGTKQ